MYGMATENLDFRLQELFEDKAELLLSKASGVPIDTIQRLRTPVASEELTPDFLNNLIDIATTLDVSVADLFDLGQSRIALVDSILDLLHHQGIDLALLEAEINADSRIHHNLEVGAFAGEVEAGTGLRERLLQVTSWLDCGACLITEPCHECRSACPGGDPCRFRRPVD